MSDNELDAELLALAGDDSSDEEDTKSIQRQSRSPSQELSRSGGKRASPAARGVAQKVRRGGRGTGARKASRRDESEEEGEASTPNSPNSLGSAAMDESESETSPGDIDDDAPLYPIEGKFRSESDRSEIMAMTEIQREEILAERAHEVEKRAQDQQLKRILQQRRREEASHDNRKKRKGEAAGLDDDSHGPRAKRSLNPALDKYKEQRQLKSDQKARGEERRREHRSPSRDADHSERDADADSDVEWDEPPHKTKPVVSREELPADLRDFERVRVGRTNFAKVCFYPTFDSAIKGCFCRVSIGVNKENGEPQYRMAQIKGLVEGKPYQMEGPNGKLFVTDQYALVAHGKAEKEWPFISCSDSKFSEFEFDRYKRALTTDSLRVPTRKYLHQKLSDIHALLDHQWTESDIQNKINRQAALHTKFATYGREKLVKRRDEAAARGDDTTVSRLDQELLALDGGAASKSFGSAGRSNGPSKAALQQERLAALNKANRKANTEDVRKAQLAEKRLQQRARDEAIAKARQREAEAAEVAKNKLLNTGDDLFGDSGDLSRTATPLNATGTPKTGTPVPGTPMNGAKKLGGFRKKAIDEDAVASSMDFGIEIDI